MSEHVLVERRGEGKRQIQVIRFNRPDKKNALTRTMYATLAEALAKGDEDADIRAHVILGTPGSFSAGNDLSDFVEMAMSGKGVLAGPVQDFLRQLAAMKKPLITGVDGIAVGIGTTLNLHADMTFATRRTQFHTPFVDLALLPEAGSSLLLPARIGHQKAFAMLAAGIPLSADDAERTGLIWKVVAEDALEAEVFAAAEALAAKPPKALLIARELLKKTGRDAVQSRIEEESALFGERLKSAEALAAFQAFMTRKK